MLNDPQTQSRRLLGRMRDVMAGQGTAQQRLDRVVRLIADTLQAEVCSCYVRRAGDVLELFATEGLKASAVHATRLRFGEGLVGEIAAHPAPLKLSDAWSHPAFAYRPETGEEPFHSFLGVPILGGGKVIGVLVVQNRDQRNYSDVELETLETVAMVLAEMITSGQLIEVGELVPVDGLGLVPLRLEGLALSGGVSIGTALLHRRRVRVPDLIAADIDREIGRLETAIADMQAALDRMLAAPEMGPGEHVEILETYRMIAKDRGWIQRIGEHIRSGLTAEAAVQRAHDENRIRLSQVADPYIKERLYDLQDLADRLLVHLGVEGTGASAGDMPNDAVVIARSLGPAELMDYDRRKLRGVVLEEGSPTMHAAIVARALDIPVVARVPQVLDRIENGDQIILNGDQGHVYVRPSDMVVDLFQHSLEQRLERKRLYAAMRDLPPVSKDGVRVLTHINAGLLMDLPGLKDSGADGIGLYRTELPFLARPDLPDVEDQIDLYGQILGAADGKPVVFRTLDAGGDKVLPYWNAQAEDNPALGWRSIRITLDRPMILRHQLRALIHAAAGRELRLMFPMIADISEFRAARNLLDLELARAGRRGDALPSAVKVGTMLEVPSLMFQLPVLLEEADFLSVGSNDLMQFLFARDRGNPRLADRYDELSPAFLQALKWVVDQCDQANVPVSLCGEMAGRPLPAMALIGLGFRTLSMNVTMIGPVKAMIRSLDVAALTTYMSDQLAAPDRSLREKLKAFAIDHGVDLS